MEVYEVLEKALALIEDEKNWCQGTYKKGDALCAEGACVVVTDGRFTPRQTPGLFYSDHPEGSGEIAYVAALGALNAAIPTGSFVHNFNDNHSHAEVVALFKRAIRAEKEKAGVLLESVEEKHSETRKVYA